MLYDRVRVEPTDVSFRDAIRFAEARGVRRHRCRGRRLGDRHRQSGQSLHDVSPADFLDYVNAPIGKAMPVPGPLKPLIAIPTTAGTGSETTGVSIFDLTEHAREDRHREPAAQADARRCSIPTTRGRCRRGGGVERARRPEPRRRVVHRDAVYVAAASREPGAASGVSGLEPDQRHLGAAGAPDRRAVLVPAVGDPADDEAREQMILAASYAGVGFGNAGVHLPHGMSYPVSGQVKQFRAPGYPADHPLVPHGMSVILNAPAVFRFTASANPARHLHAAEALGANVSGAKDADAGRILADRITWFMQRLRVPNGLNALGYTSSDIPALVEGTLPQHRVTKLSPRPAGPDDLAALFEHAMVAW